MIRFPLGNWHDRLFSVFAVTSLAATALLFAGCSAEDARVAELRQRLLLPSEPESASTIAAAKEAVAEHAEVSIVARVGHDEFEAFVPDQAAFLVTEILPEEEGHRGKDHAANCPFCKRKAANVPRAAVQFLDESGSPLAFDARKLFGIRPSDVVVVRGMGKVHDELDMFQITADAIYVRPPGGSQ